MNSTPRTAVRTLAVILLGAATLCVPALAAQAEPPPLRRLTVQGNVLLTREQVLNALGLREGDAFDAQRVEAAVRRFNEAGLLGTAGFRVEPSEDGVEVAVSISEALRLTAVRFSGNERFSGQRLQELSGLSPGSVLRAIDLDAARRRIVGAYRDEGYPGVSVEGRVLAATEHARVVAFQIQEGTRSWVARIEFEGNEQVASDELRKTLESGTRRWPSWIWPGWFDETTFRADLIALEHACRNRGYLDARLDGDLEPGEEPGSVVLRIKVSEGPLYTIREVTFEGNTLFRDDELLAAIPTLPGEPYRPDDVDNALQTISDLYADQGYWDVTEARGNLEVQDVLAETGTDVSMRYRIREGEPVAIGQIHVHGLTKTNEMVVRRNLTFYPGERAARRKLIESERMLLNSGYFDFAAPRPVEITLEPSEGALRDAVVRVQEGPTGRLMLTGGVGSETGLMAGVAIEENNFDLWNWPSSWDDFWHGNALRGAGHRLSISLNTGTRRSYYAVTFENPALWNSEYSFGTSLYSRGIARNDFDETRTGLSLTFGHRLTRYTHRSVTVGYESIDLDDLTNPAPRELRRERGRHGKPYIRADASVDRRDNRFLPSEGHYLGGSVELALGDVGAVTARLQGEQYRTIHQRRGRHRHVVGVRGQLATILGDAPIYERLYAGGFSSLRGFAFEGVSPSHDPTDVLVGGKSMAVGSLEYSMPLTESDALRLVTFCDAGTVQPNSTGAILPFRDLRMSVGTGLRWQVPALGPAALELDFALPVMKESDDRTQYFHFSLAAQRRF
ncbi:MAG: outer membrane protein assembly factor BamA [Candidatus Brocadiaceae bacterium]|nr:outer membrane protein assembly factor BamA [Candidatus Brocadiaceae bacterium]